MTLLVEKSFFPRLGHFIQALFSFLLLSSSKGLIPLKGGQTPEPIWQIHPTHSAGTSNLRSGLGGEIIWLPSYFIK